MNTFVFATEKNVPAVFPRGFPLRTGVVLQGLRLNLELHSNNVQYLVERIGQEVLRFEPCVPEQTVMPLYRRRQRKRQSFYMDGTSNLKNAIYTIAYVPGRKGVRFEAAVLERLA